ncbi:adenosine deaminase/editase, partial [Auricularia subglabra TFB-10046 SS5]
TAPDSLVVAATHKAFAKLRFSPAPGTFTVCASFALTRGEECKLLAVCTGTKCLPMERLPAAGDALHDSHAEVLARRGALKWCLGEIARSEAAAGSRWLQQTDDGTYALRPGVQLSMYISMLPCGDASMGLLAAQQDPTMAAKMSAAHFQPLSPDIVSRGRVDYARLGVLRTKPGRADSPPTACMSCSDKIATWTVCGIQGALGSTVLRPLYIDSIIIGDIAPEHWLTAAQDCQRAFESRLSALPLNYRHAVPRIAFCSLQFPYSRTATGVASSSHESLCWTADTSGKLEVLVDGIRRGLTPRQRLSPKTRPSLSKAALFQLWRELSPHADLMLSYASAKALAVDYRTAKGTLRGPGRPFAAWRESNASGTLEQFRHLM